ncbi:septal ring lytic transglycosylase RlpA family protein [Aquitalea sp. S1-19]|nr:septal ring lytic transglycosylase RlpA family protein [Aquitalea sp. S1-19]
MQSVLRWLWLTIVSLVLVACSTTQPANAKLQPVAKAPQKTSSKGGAYFQNDGPARIIPANLNLLPNAVPQDEPLIRSANLPYSALGMRFRPDTSHEAFQTRGKASWYGKQFHGRKTSSGERYDMFAMTGAHPTLPIPSYAKVTNLKNGQSVIVRINDRGPFHKNRVMDLSYAAAHQLGYINSGSADVLVERVFPAGDGERIATRPARQLAKSDKPIYLQLGSYATKVKAEARIKKLMAKLPDQHDEKLTIVKQLGAYRVQMGPFETPAAAQKAASDTANRLNTGKKIVMT